MDGESPNFILFQRTPPKGPRLTPFLSQGRAAWPFQARLGQEKLNWSSQPHGFSLAASGEQLTSQLYTKGRLILSKRNRTKYTLYVRPFYLKVHPPSRSDGPPSASPNSLSRPAAITTGKGLAQTRAFFAQTEFFCFLTS